jgi:hypothetical protein
MNKFIKIIKSWYYEQKYKKTIDLLYLLLEPNDDDIIKGINEASLNDLNQDIDKYIKLANPNYDYNSTDPNVKMVATVLGSALRNSSDKVIFALLDKKVDIHHFNAYNQIFKRRENKNPKEESLIAITQKFLDLGLNLNWFNISTIASNHDRHIQLNHENYLTCAIKASTNYIGDGSYAVDSFKLKHLKFLIEKGLEKQENDGNLIYLGVCLANVEIIDVILSLKGVDSEYIQKGLNQCIESNKEPEHLQYKSVILRKNKEAIDYIQVYLEKLQLENGLSEVLTPENELKITKKLKI